MPMRQEIAGDPALSPTLSGRGRVAARGNRRPARRHDVQATTS